MTRSTRNTGPAVVITDSGHANGLGIARAASVLGVPVIGLCRDGRAPTSRSRHWNRLVTVADDGSEACLESLLELGRQRDDRPVLFAVQDDVVLLMSAHRDVLEQHYRFVLPDHSTVELLSDKTAFAAWATKHGIPIPETFVVGNELELRSVLERTRYPAILKPLFRTSGWQARSPTHKVYRLSSPASYDEIGFDVFATAPRFVIQQWIEGTDADVRFCLTYRDREGRSLASHTGRKLLQWPVATGSTAVCVSADDPELERLTDRVFDLVGFRGLGSLEVKRSADDGAYYITEPTIGRTNLQSYLAVAAGVNLVALAYYDALGRVDQSGRVRTRDAIWIHEHAAVRSLVVSMRNGAVPWRELLRGLLRNRKAFAHFAPRDPWPAVALGVRVLGATVARQLRKIGRRGRSWRKGVGKEVRR
jgi:D-aspartate ligase